MPRPKSAGTVLLVGAEPCTFSCAFSLLEQGVRVKQVYCEPFGLFGASRDIGLAYPELGEPWERLAYSLGEDIALEFHNWSKWGIEDLGLRAGDLVTRGSRLALARTEQESKLLSEDALLRSKPPVGDELRLMSGAAVSNYAPVDGAHLGSFETHCLAFAPAPTLQALRAKLGEYSHYEAHEQSDLEHWKRSSVDCQSKGVCYRDPDREVVGDICVVGAGLDTARLLNRFHKILVPIEGQAFRSQALKEKARSSVVGITASWGYERYRFDSEYRLLACGVDPTGSGGGTAGEVNDKVMDVFLKRAQQLFTDLEGHKDELMQWAVQFDGTCDGLPLLGPLPGEPKIQVLAGFAQSGWSRGWEGGRQLARAVANTNEETLSPLLGRCSPRRFL